MEGATDNGTHRCRTSLPSPLSRSLFWLAKSWCWRSQDQKGPKKPPVLGPAVKRGNKMKSPFPCIPVMVGHNMIPWNIHQPCSALLRVQVTLPKGTSVASCFSSEAEEWDCPTFPWNPLTCSPLPPCGSAGLQHQFWGSKGAAGGKGIQGTSMWSWIQLYDPLALFLWHMIILSH